MKFRTGIVKKLSVSMLAITLVSTLGFAPAAHAGSPSSVGYYYTSGSCQSWWHWFPNLYNYNSTGQQYSNYSFRPGAFCLVSNNSQYRVVFQTDGNLVVYKSNNNGPQQAIWASNTNGAGATRLTLQTDGNMVIYRSYTPLWNSNTYSRMATRVGSPSTINMQTDGNLVIYDSNNRPYWSTWTGPIYY